MPKTVQIGNRLVGDNQPVFIVAEIGINHNGDINLAKKLIDAAFLAGCDAVKFQKRTPERCVPADQLDKSPRNPLGPTNRYMEHRYKVEFGLDEYPAHRSTIVRTKNRCGCLLLGSGIGRLHEDIRRHRVSKSLPHR